MKAFAGDHNIKDEIIKLRDRFGIKTAIETGTHLGNTALELSEMFDDVISVEINEQYFAEASVLVGDRVKLHLGDSRDVLSGLKFTDPVFFYLDAHWGVNPLLDEIRLAGKVSPFPVIAIHDFKVPSGFGYDTYDGQPYTFDWIESALMECYPHGFEYHYNTIAEGAKRGVIYVYPKIKDDD